MDVGSGGGMDGVVADAMRLSEQLVHPLLAGRHPAIQAAIVADVLSMFLASHPKEVREQIMAEIVKVARELTPVNAVKIRRRAGPMDNTTDTVTRTPTRELTPERLAELQASAEKSVILCVIKPEELAALIRMAGADRQTPHA